MKFTIAKATNRLELIKFFRKEINNLSLQEAVYYTDNLPYAWNDMTRYEVEDLRKRTKNFADSEVEEDIEEEICNINISLPPEYFAAMAWFETLSNEDKAHVDVIAMWRYRPAVC